MSCWRGESSRKTFSIEDMGYGFPPKGRHERSTAVTNSVPARVSREAPGYSLQTQIPYKNEKAVKNFKKVKKSYLLGGPAAALSFDTLEE
jgi:hypothetical protein